MAAHIKTGNFLLPWQANAVSAHRAQTLLVEELLRRGTLSWSQVRNSEDPETGDEREIFEWHFFQEFGDFDYRALEKA
jgi:hypothetical protein